MIKYINLTIYDNRGRMETEFYVNPGGNMKMVNNNGRMVGPREPDLVKDRNSSMPR